MGKVIQFTSKDLVKPKKLTKEQIAIARRDLYYDDESDLQTLYEIMMNKGKSVYLWTRCEICNALQIIEATKINDKYLYDCNCKRCKTPIQIFMRELTEKELGYMQEYNRQRIVTISLESYISDKMCEETEKILNE